MEFMGREGLNIIMGVGISKKDKIRVADGLAPIIKR